MYSIVGNKLETDPMSAESLNPGLCNILHVKDRNSVTEVCSSARVINDTQAECRLAFHLHKGAGEANSWNNAATAWRGFEKAQ